MHQSEVPAPRIHTVAQFSERFPAWSPASLRALIFAAGDRVTSGGRVVKGNGLAEAGALLKVGRRVLIDEARFVAWLAEQRKGATPSRS